MNIADLARMWLTRTTKPFLFENKNDSKLDFLELNNLGIYIHVPFCREICNFCPYCKTLYEETRVRNYIDALIKEIHLVGGGSEIKKDENPKVKKPRIKKTVTSVYIGGGSPAICSRELKEVLDTLREYFIITEGIGVELHPYDINEKTLKTLKEIGVDKISIGIQSFQDNSNSMLDRKAPSAEHIKSYLDKVKFDTVSMDFIFAIPGQTFEILKKDIDLAFHTGANHIALYPFIEFSFNKDGGKAMDEKSKRKLMEQMIDYCESKGYERTSLWTFSKGKHSYSSMTRDNFLGFGCSATTLLKDQFKINTFSVEEYISKINNNELPTSLTCRLNLRQRMIYYLFWVTYSTVVDPKEFEKFFGKPLMKFYGLEFFIARLLKFIKKEGSIYKLTTKGTYYYHYFEGFYTLSYIDKMWSVLRLEAYPEDLLL